MCVEDGALRSVFIACVVARWQVLKRLVNIWGTVGTQKLDLLFWHGVAEYGSVIDTGFKDTLEGTFAMILCLFCVWW